MARVPRSLLVSLLAVFVGGAAAAEPTAVQYFSRLKDFKKARSTDVLLFEVFSDASCTTLIASENLFAADALVHYYKDKALGVKKGPKPPKAVRVHAVLDIPLTVTAPYLRVTGPGIVPEGSDCQLQVSGPVAALGPQGDPGPQGPAGADGAQGIQGDSGPAGPAGADGAQGPQGDPGPAGPAGPQGDPGPAGPQGPAGADGADGAQGPQGDSGPPGPAGADGAQGLQGDPGPAGPAGADGAQGPQGDPGTVGPAGAQGDPGPAGPAGADGAQGPQGDPGTVGPAGAQGDPGPAGPAGADGAQGPQGDPGPVGPAGPQGDPGPAGPQGPAGADGADGAQGPQGDPGPAGPAGADGAQGPQGDPGPSGTSGSLIGGTYDNPPHNSYLIPWDVLTSGSLSTAEIPVSSGTASKLFVRLSSALTSGSITVTIYRNGNPTALTCTIEDPDISCSDTATTVSFDDGDLLTARYSEGGGQNRRVKFSILYTAP